MKKMKAPVAPDLIAAESDLPRFAAEIRKTGFVLENKVAQALNTAGWTVISNKYYVDDASSTVREIDLIAYRIDEVDGISVYTVLIVNCKQSLSSAWALLTRKLDKRDPNTDWWPLHIWSNDKVLNSYLREPGEAKTFLKEARTEGAKRVFALPKIEVFAFQEMSRTTAAPNTDKNIYESITALMKAQAYEMAALPARKAGHPSIYQFNLLTVVGTDLLQLAFESDQIRCSRTESEQHLARYIISGKETFARIRIVRESSLDEALEDFLDVHRHNCKWVDAKRQLYFRNPMTDEAKIAVLEQDFLERINARVKVSLHSARMEPPAEPLSRVYIQPPASKGGAVRISLLDLSTEQSAHVTKDPAVQSQIKAALKAVYRYTGPFEISDEIPF